MWDLLQLIDMRRHQNEVLWNGINLDSKGHADIKAQTNIQIFGLISVLPLLVTKIGNHLFVCCLKWTNLTKYNQIFKYYHTIVANFKATLTNFRPLSEVVAVNQLKLTSFYQKTLLRILLLLSIS